MRAIMVSTPLQEWSAPDATIDARGLECPEPVLRLRQALRGAPTGFRVRVQATDPHATLDFEAYCARSGHALEGAAAESGVLWFQIRKASKATT